MSQGFSQTNQNSGQGLTEMYSIDVIDLVRRKFWFILFFVLLALALSLLFYFKAPKTFESTSRLVVEEQSAPSLNSTDGEAFATEKPVEKYIEIIKSAKILNPAIDDGKFDDLKTFADSENILMDLRECLVIRPADVKGESGVIYLEYQNGYDEETQSILLAIVESFESYIKNDTRSVGGETVQIVETVQHEMLVRLQQVEKEIRELSAKPDMLFKDGNVLNSFQVQQANLQEDLHELRRERTRLQARLDNIQLRRYNGASTDNLVNELLQEMNESSLGGYVTTHQKYVQLKIDEQQLLNEYGDQHPELVALRNQIAMVNQLRMQELAALRGGQPGSGIGNSQPRDLVDVYIEQMTNKIKMLESEENSLSNAVKSEQTNSIAIASDVENLLALQRERERLEKGYYALIDRLNEINVLKDHDWRTIEILDAPSKAEQASPNLPISLGAGLLLGCLLGLLFAGLKEMAEKTFRSSEDIAAVLGSRVVGHIAQFHRLRPPRKTNYPAAAPELVTLHNPTSPHCESYRGIRTALFFKTSETQGKVIQVSSPIPGDGKSTTISNLAVSIAQAGRKVLLIDADFRKPVQHKLFGLSNEIGMSSVLCGETSLDEAIQEIQPGFLSAITCGPLPGNPAELLTSNGFENLLADLRKDYDFILVDTPPLLAVTDPSIVSAHADLVYLVLRIRNGVRTNASRAKEILDSVGVNLGGVIINGLRRKDQKTYDYGGSRRGYGGYGGYGSYGGYQQVKPGRIQANGQPQRQRLPSPADKA